MRGCLLGGDERIAHTLFETHAPILARSKQAPRVGLGVRGERPDANGGERFRMPFARPVIFAVKPQRLLDSAAVTEEIRVRVRQAEMRGELRAVIRAAED